MRMWSGSHKDDLKDHNQMFNEGNLLTRGQTVNNVPRKKTIPLILEACDRVAGRTSLSFSFASKDNDASSL